MNTIPSKIVNKTISHFQSIEQYLRIPTNDTENQLLIDLTRKLKIKLRDSNNPAITSLLDLVLTHIETYEKRAFPIKPLKPGDMLAFLMEQNYLTQSDLPEIGSQSHVSKILSGDRQLTRNQINLLAKKFNVSPAVFFE